MGIETLGGGGWGSCFVFEASSHNSAQAGAELMILLLQPSEC